MNDTLFTIIIQTSFVFTSDDDGISKIKRKKAQRYNIPIVSVRYLRDWIAANTSPNDQNSSPSNDSMMTKPSFDYIPYIVLDHTLTSEEQHERELSELALRLCRTPEKQLELPSSLREREQQKTTEAVEEAEEQEEEEEIPFDENFNFQLPLEIWDIICSMLDHYEMIRISQVSKVCRY